jgi:hypothetical protein
MRCLRVCFCLRGGWSLLDGKCIVLMAVTAVSHTDPGLGIMRIPDINLKTVDKE